MRAHTIALFAPLLLAACGGGNDNNNGSGTPPDLQGVWYQVDAGFSGQYSYPALFVQTGRDIVRRECDRSTTRLRLDGDALVHQDGMPYSLQPAGDNLLLGHRGASAGEEMRRFSRAPVFDSGRVSLALPPLTPLQAAEDVCAVKGGLTLRRDDGSELIAATVMIAAPYQGGHAEVRMTLPRRTDVFPYSVRTGELAIRDRAGFLQQPDSSAQVELWSPAYAAAYGQNTVQVSAGTLRVATAGNGVFSFEGSMRTASGAPVTFSAQVTLERKP